MTEQVNETVEITGHLMDSGILSRVLDDIREYDGDYVIEHVEIGHEKHDTSYARLIVSTDDEDTLQRLLMRLQTRGVNMVHPGDVVLAEATQSGVFPDGFYSTTNLDTHVRIGERWVAVEHPEMDCGLIVDGSGAPRVYTLPMSDVQKGMK